VECLREVHEVGDELLLREVLVVRGVVDEAHRGVACKVVVVVVGVMGGGGLVVMWSVVG